MCPFGVPNGKQVMATKRRSVKFGNTLVLDNVYFFPSFGNTLVHDNEKRCDVFFVLYITLISRA